MARLLLCCDETIYRIDGRFYFKSNDWKDFFYRYLRVFDELQLITRCKDEDHCQPGRILMDDIRIKYIPLPNFQGPKQYLSVYSLVGNTLSSAAEGCDAALLRLPFSVSNRAINQIRKRNIPYAVEVCACAKDMGKTSNSILHKLLWAIQDRGVRKICYKADGVACVTQKYLQQYYFSKKPNHFTGSYSSLALEDSFYQSPKELKLNGPYIITHVANQIFLESQKGHKELVDALSLLKLDKIDVRLYFVGESYFGGVEKLREYAKSMGVEDMIVFTGYLNRNQMHDTLLKTDLVVFPSKSEGLPRVIIESMAFGIPCLSTPVGGIPELLPSQFLVNCFDSKVLADNIKRLLTDKELYSSASSNNFERSKYYRAEVLQEKRDDFYSKLKRIVG